MNSDDDKKIIYSLGGGCWAHADIPLKYRVNGSLFKGSSAIDDKNGSTRYFTPRMIFEQNYFRENFFDYSKWTAICAKPEWLKGQVFDLRIQNEALNLKYHHLNIWKKLPIDINYVEEMVDEFEKNKYRYFYVIDFQRTGYPWFSNKQLLDFEELVEKQGFDLNRFVYIDTNKSPVKDRFGGCKIRSFINNVNDVAGYNEADKTFRNTKCFFAKHMDYVLDIIDKG